MIRKGSFCYANAIFLTIGGLSADDLKLLHPLDLVSPDDRESVRSNAISMLKGLRTTPYEYTIRDYRGNTRCILESVSSIRLEGSLATLGHFMDVTEVRVTRRSLEASELKYCSFYELARDISEREALLRALRMASEEWRRSFDALDDTVLLISPDFRILRRPGWPAASFPGV